jgi:hypothetical protein
MPKPATGQLRELAHGWEARISVRGGTRKAFQLYGCENKEAAKKRTEDMAQYAQEKRRSGSLKGLHAELRNMAFGRVPVEAPKKGDPVERWYRVRFDADGSMRSVEAVLERGLSGGSVAYVSATDEDAAAAKAYRLKAREAQRKRRAELKSKGLCKCGCEREDPSVSICNACLQRSRVYAERAAARKRGEEVPERSKKESFASRRESDLLRAQLDVLYRVKSALLRSRTVKQADEWVEG